ncbi:nuclear transport factor 2 family protein [Prolixibacteraceae bacterium Z1-6]|uniref:Nuclear transport factor 2 family protein n=1 Tax=Draconibacterium aestuarii TaxID=2998507 RepID=A0A9X3F2A6_9BACT|nr:nuclear transport factor 2 family protein [Prolixibacteraceae bacterium Z1-6]
MRLLFVGFFVALFSITSHAKTELKEAEKREILSLLHKQAEAWNEGNLEKFMETYLNSEKLVFIGGNGPTYGWQATLDRYKKNYPNKAAIGKLEFKILNISKIDTRTVFLIGRFELTREIGNLAGHFTLVIQKIDGKWLIVSDHSSAEG